MRRRKFLQLVGLGGGALVVLPGLGYVSISVKEAAQELIVREFDYLRLDAKGVEQYVEDYFTVYSDMTKHSSKIKSYNLLRLDASNSKLIDHLTRNYLQSTDFFKNKMDESLPVNYLGFFNPYKTPCTNPFSSLYYPAASVS